MEYINSLNEIKLKNTALSIGKFDAIHKGHRRLLDIINTRKELDTCVFSILVNEDHIFTKEERLQIFKSLGISKLIEINFDDLKEIGYKTFIEEILILKLGVKFLACGNDFRFGKNAIGTAMILEDCKKRYDYECKIIDKIEYKKLPISSSRIKEYIIKGKVEDANLMLGCDFFIQGEVVYGNQLGRTIGVPTANIVWPDKKISPPNGVYACEIEFNSRLFKGIANIGIKPTVMDDSIKLIEVHIFDFDNEIYGKSIKVNIKKFIRKEEKFSSFEQLEKVLKKDIIYVKNFFNYF